MSFVRTIEFSIETMLLHKVHTKKNIIGTVCINDLEMGFKTHPICKPEIQRNLSLETTNKSFRSLSRATHPIKFFSKFEYRSLNKS